MLRTALAAVAAVVAIGLISAPTANASCTLHGQRGHYSTACQDEDRAQSIRDTHRVQRFEMGWSVAEKALRKFKPGYRANFPAPAGVVKIKPKFDN